MTFVLGLTVPAFRHFAIASSSLALKAIALSLAVSSTRILTNTFTIPEDSLLATIIQKITGIAPSASDKSNEKKIARAGRINQRIDRLNACLSHDVNNTPLLLLAGLAYVVVCNPDKEESARVFGTLVAGRFLHTVAYAFGLQPFRTIGHLAAFSAAVEMSIKVLVALV
ncbi:UNVERIFIED_CONTAM: hypothetical protein HDU68_007863 [Siphonaria sp. JEL0065]|nr:hypothetical protein HDU68_007863 [Siphonaria sp. JEL0065]